MSILEEVDGMAAPFYAHSAKGRPWEEWQLLIEHLANVAKGARERAEAAGWLLHMKEIERRGLSQ